MNFDIDICRVCLRSGADTSIFNDDGSEQFYVKIMTCTSVEISIGDGLPTVLCNSCVTDLNTSYNFKNLCESADVKLRKILSHHLKNQAGNIDKQLTDQKFIFTDYFLRHDNLQPEINFALEKLDVTVTYNNLNDVKAEFLESPIDESLEANNEEPHDEKTTRKNNIKEKEMIEDSGTFACELCDENSENKLGLIQHSTACARKPMQFDDNSSEVKADIVQTQFYDNIKMLENNPYIENKIRRITRVKRRRTVNSESCTCEFCGKNFKLKEYLDKHHNTCGCNPAQLICKICSKSFKDKYILNRHVRLHEGPKPLKPKRHMCDLCGHTFHDQYGLNMHKRCHSGQRPFICNVCGHRFSQQSNMERHIKAKHEKVRPFQCTICSKVFAYSYVLTEHYKTHTGEKDHECGICGRKFAKKFALNRHMLTHTLERPFKCKLCDRAYTQSNDLKAHVKRAHEKEFQPVEMDFHIENQISNNSLLPSDKKLPVLQ